MTSSEVRRDLLTQHATLRIRCQDELMPCCAYTMASCCSVIRHVLEDAPPTDGVVPLPNIEAQPVRTALDLIHGIMEVTSTPLATIPEAIKGMSVLGCHAFDRALVGRAWDILRDQPLASLQPWLPPLLTEPTTRRQVMRRIIHEAGPGWANIIDTIRKTMIASLDVMTATFLMSSLVKMYPAGMVAKSILAMMPHATLAQALAITCPTSPAIGVYYHPGEIADLFRYLHGRYPNAGGMVTTVAEGLGSYESVPRAGAMVCSGSVVTFSDDDTCHASAMIIIDGAMPSRYVAIANWLTVRTNPYLDVRIKAGVIDDRAKRCKGIQVRAMAYVRSTGKGRELWVAWNTTADAWTPCTSASMRAQESIRPQLDTINEIIRSNHTRHVILRIDVFYGKTSVLTDPLV